MNDEANRNVLDRDAARRLEEDFEADKAPSRRIPVAKWRRRPWTQKLAEQAAGPLRSRL